MKTKNVTKAFFSAFQCCKSQIGFISPLREVTVGNYAWELDLKSSSQLLTIETVRVMFIIYCWMPCLAILHKYWFNYGFVKLYLDIFSYSVFPDPDIIQII